MSSERQAHASGEKLTWKRRLLIATWLLMSGVLLAVALTSIQEKWLDGWSRWPVVVIELLGALMFVRDCLWEHHAPERAKVFARRLGILAVLFAQYAGRVGVILGFGTMLICMVVMRWEQEIQVTIIIAYCLGIVGALLSLALWKGCEAWLEGVPLPLFEAAEAAARARDREEEGAIMHKKWMENHEWRRANDPLYGCGMAVRVRCGF